MEQLDPRWRKASYSGNGGANCVEVGSIPWRKASYSANGGEQCIEAGSVAGIVLIRDTMNREGFTLSVPAATWRTFANQVKAL